MSKNFREAAIHVLTIMVRKRLIAIRMNDVERDVQRIVFVLSQNEETLKNARITSNATAIEALDKKIKEILSDFDKQNKGS